MVEQCPKNTRKGQILGLNNAKTQGGQIPYSKTANNMGTPDMMFEQRRKTETSDIMFEQRQKKRKGQKTIVCNEDHMASNARNARTTPPDKQNQTKRRPGRLELPTLRLTASRSNQLSYGSARALGQSFAGTTQPNQPCNRCKAAGNTDNALQNQMIYATGLIV